MYPQRNDAIWKGSLKFVPAVVAAILVLSTATLGLSAAYGKQLADAPLRPEKVQYQGAHRWSNTFFVFYSATTPVLTIIHAALDLILYLMALLRPVYALIGSVIFVCGWAIQVAFWTQCDIPASLEIGTSYPRYQDNIQRDGKGSLIGISATLAQAKVAFAFVTFFVYITYMSFAAAAVHKKRKNQKAVAYPGLGKTLSSEGYEVDNA